MSAYYDLLSQARNWAEQTVQSGRLHAEQTQALFDIDHTSPQTLFSNREHNASKPLLVAFMGGTGVGKSSLLNRLAQYPIAKAGIERPTSREVTLYHHQAISVQQLPDGLPLQSVKLSHHNNPDQENIIWMDMPDFDSIELGNHTLVKQWLPYIDVLLYVVSPERYRDNKAWQLLLNEGMKHAWLFVMNQWDRGQPEQFLDFKQQLLKAGFNNPLIFRTSCSEPDGDEFASLLTQLHTLSEQHSVVQLEQRNEQWRNQQLQAVLQQLLDETAQRNFLQLQKSYTEFWEQTETSFTQGLAWPLQNLAKVWAEHPSQKPTIKLWDEWAQSRFDDILDEVVLQAAQLNIPSKPLKTRLQHVKIQAEKKVRHYTELAGREALLNPGTKLQRFLLKFTAISETLLPLAAMGVVGYQVFIGYFHSSMTNDTTAYLGVDFAVHSVMLIALSWLIPFFVHKKIQPSLEKNALRGLRKGLQQALSYLNQEIENALSEEQSHNADLQQELRALMAKVAPLSVHKPERDSLLDRVLINS
jgi:GTPase Era involved in 16S rRNA processing